MIIPLIKAYLLFMESEHKRHANSQKKSIYKFNRISKGNQVQCLPNSTEHALPMNVLLVGAFVTVLKAFITNVGQFCYDFIVKSLCRLCSWCCQFGSVRYEVRVFSTWLLLFQNLVKILLVMILSFKVMESKKLRSISLPKSWDVTSSGLAPARLRGSSYPFVTACVGKIQT